MLAKVTATLIVCAFALLGLIDRARAEEGGLAAEVKFCEKLEKFKPVDAKTTFPAGTKKLYGWTLITGGKGAFTVNHTWLKNGKQVFKHTVNAKGARYPTWSFLKSLSKGSYKLEVSDEAGKVFATGEFTVE